MTRMTGPDCVVMCNLINTYIHTYIHSAFTQAGSLEYCSGGENGGKKGQGGVGLAVRTSVTHAAHPPEFISDRLLKITLELRDRERLLRFMWRMPQPQHTMLVINMHPGRPWM